MNVITAYGLSLTITGQDGIDQGDGISSLLWRIFYDPLLVALQTRTDGYTRGYHISVQWPSDVSKPQTWLNHSESVSVLVYMDDTCFIDSSQQRIQDTINLANEFYELHDIYINGRKSELIAINPSLAPHEVYVTFGQENVIVKATNDEI